MTERLGPFEIGRVARVFPRRTKATPSDALAFVGNPPMFLPAISRVLVSCAFTWDIPEAERLAKAWEHVAPVGVGGPAFGLPEGDFEPGKFLRPDYTITSRGCPNRCWFCRVWRRQPTIQELPIRDGWIVQDDNLLACSEPHIRAVFAMLERQPEKAVFSGGLEAARLMDWHVDLLARLKPERAFFSYDTTDDWEPLVEAAKKLRAADLLLPNRTVRCYILGGYPGDTPDAAEKRCKVILTLGLTPFFMLYFDDREPLGPEWTPLQRRWCSAQIIFAKKTAKDQQPALFGEQP